jgi:hypothetical protein
VEAESKGGSVDLYGEITPMDFVPNLPRTNTMAETPTCDSVGTEAQGTNKAEPIMKTTDKRRKGINLKAWKRRARKDDTTNCEGNGGKPAGLKRKAPQLNEVGKDTGRGKRTRMEEGEQDFNEPLLVEAVLQPHQSS